MERTISHDAESLRKRFLGLERFSGGALILLLEVVRAAFISRLKNPDFMEEHRITEVHLCSDTLRGSCYVAVVDGRQVQISFLACDLDIRGYNGSWHLTSCIVFRGNEAAMLYLNRLFLDFLAQLDLEQLKEKVRNLLAANPNHFVLIDHRRPFYDLAV